MGDVSAEPSMEDILSSIKRIIAEDGEAPAPRPRRPVRASPVADPTPARDEHEDEVLELSDLAPVEPAAAVEAPGDTIVSRRAAEASRDSLAALSRLIVKPEVEGSDTLEGLVRAMLKPMLRDWLDANLPELVEAMVAKEISRITGSR